MGIFSEGGKSDNNILISGIFQKEWFQLVMIRLSGI
jgi:hypothetical protein